MNELRFVRERQNVILGRYNTHGKTYSWYLPYELQKVIHVGDIEIINSDGNKDKIIVVSFKYEKNAKLKYKNFPYRRGIASWQVQHICRYLKSLGYDYSRERHFKGLMNERGLHLGMDIVFCINKRMCVIEYNGVHHYNNQSPRYKNFKNNMDIKRNWCRQNDVPLLEIPFWWQNDLDSILNLFITSVLSDKG